MNRRIEQIGKQQVRYYREPQWSPGTCWVFLANGPDEGRHTYVGLIERTENPRRYNGKRLKADAALSLLVEAIR